MKTFRYVVDVKADCRHDADQVMSERLGHDEQYEDDQGRMFDYEITNWYQIPSEPERTPLT